MPALTSVLFPEPSLRRSPAAIWRWWESHRFTYNVIVGSAGLFTLAVTHSIFFPARMLTSPMTWLIALTYGVCANVCYSFGAPLELALARWLKREPYGVGPALFRHGLVYSVGLTLFPIALAAVATVVKILTHLAR